jgi:hypothetical protein
VRGVGGVCVSRLTIALHLILLFYRINIGADVITPFAVTLTRYVLVHRVSKCGCHSQLLVVLKVFSL